ncbi:hypothetical protein RUM43_004168 [Polyplax serrata]|uniref:PDZ domain-containing protein n=1 Tax=Polyplax serrata TaxID=468196 RepID=A0AAN8SAL1_POLSC
MLTASSPFLPTASLTPKTSPALSLRKSSSGKLTDEQTPDPTSCPIQPGKEVLIEINKEKLGLGLSIIGGCDTALGVAIVHEIYPESAAAKDGRLQPGDQILEINSENLSKTTHAKAQTLLRQAPPKVKLLVYRDESITKDNLLQVSEIELLKKPGKGLGLSIAAKKDGSQVFVSEIVHGGVAEIDGRLLKGDYILEVNGISLKGTNQETVAAILKSCTGKVSLKTGRIRCKKFSNSPVVRNPLPLPVTDLNELSVEVNGTEDPNTENALVNGCFRIKRTSSLRSFVRSFSIRKRHV